MKARSVLARVTVLVAVMAAAAREVRATTFDLPLNGEISIAGDFSTPYSPSIYGTDLISVQAIENVPLPVFDPLNPTTTVGVFNWVATFSVTDQNGAVAEPSLSPAGVALVGYGQNCSVTPFCPRPSGDSSLTILSGSLWISGDATLAVSTFISTLNIPSYDLQLQVTLPDSLSITPIPSSWLMFAAGLAIIGLIVKGRPSARA